MYIQDVLLRVKSATTGAFVKPVPLFWFIAAAVIAPFMFLILGATGPNNLPWYFWTMISVLVLVVVSVGFWMFARDSHKSEDISIRPRPY